jgi:hypothetical protein
MGTPSHGDGPRPRPAVPGRPVRRLLGALSLVLVAALPTGLGGLRLVPADDGGGFVLRLSTTPAEITLAQFTQFTASGSDAPSGTHAIRLNGTQVGTVTPDSSGNFAAADFPFPAGTAHCDGNTVTVDGVTDSTTITVFCPAVSMAPNPVFSGGTPTDVAFHGSGFGATRPITFALDGASLDPDPSHVAQSAADGTVTRTIPGATLTCGSHTLTATINQPPIESPHVVRFAASTTTYPPPTFTTTINVLGCPNSTPRPQIFADPIETGIDQFTRFSVQGEDLAAGPATIKLQGVAVGTVAVGADGSFPTTDFDVPANTATCGTDAVTIDDVTPAIASSSISVFCPALTVTPNPVFSGGAPAGITISGNGYPGDRPVDFTVDGHDVGTVSSDGGGAVTLALPNAALACGDHQVIGAAQPLPSPGLRAHAIRRAVVPFDPPIPATADVNVLGCTDSPTPPQIRAIPVETTLAQFTRFTVDGSLLPTGPATIRLQGAAAGPVAVDGEGTFPSTDFKVPANSARCGANTVSIDRGGPALATAPIAVYCPAVTATPNPVDSGGRAATLTVAGTGFPPDRPIDLGFDGQARTTVTSDANGAVHGTISGVTPACGRHQASGTAHPPAGATPADAQSFLPISATTGVTVVGCARLAANPDVIEQGLLTHVVGTGFLPKTPLTLTWQNTDGSVIASCSPNAVTVPSLATDAAGRLDVFCLAYPHEAVGSVLIAAMQSPERETVSVIIDDGSMQPSNGNQLVFRR